MVQARFKPIDPEQRLRDLRKESKELAKLEPGPERAVRLAAFVREAHDQRQLNMAMHAAQQCLDEDPDSPDLLLAAYIDDESLDAEERLRMYTDLADLARYIDRPDLVQVAQDHLARDARSFYAEADSTERRHRLRILTSVLDRETADRIRDEIEFG